MQDWTPQTPLPLGGWLDVNLFIPTWLWCATIALYLGLFALDLIVVARRPHVPSTRECVLWLAFYVSVAIGFGAVLWVTAGHEIGVQFFAGWVTEYSLSVDNLFVFILIMARFSYHERCSRRC